MYYFGNIYIQAKLIVYNEGEVLMIKLIASDMDGTLLDSNKKLNNEFYEVLDKISDKNILFAAVSGRELISLKNIFKDVNKDIIYAANNGNLIMYKDKILFENNIEKHMIDKIAPIIRKISKHNTIYCTKDCVYSESIVPSIIGWKWKLKVKVVKDITKLDIKIIKVTTFGNEKLVNKNLKILEPLKNELMITASGSKCFDICKLGGNKEQGIKILQEKFKINYEETMVFGDHMNDLEMMDSAYYSYAMENAKEDVKNSARFIAKTNDENGVLEVIKEVALGEGSIHKNVELGRV